MQVNAKLVDERLFLPISVINVNLKCYVISFNGDKLLGLYAQASANISTSVQRCFKVDMTSRRRTTSNQRWNNFAYVSVEIYNIEQRWNNVVYFNVELNNVRQCRNNVVVFNVDFHNVGQRWNNVANMTISKKTQISLDSKAK